MQSEKNLTSPNPAALEMKTVMPGGVVGILGGGQLGRMFGIAARRMGYRVHAFEPHPDSPAGHVSDVEINAGYDDFAALEKFASGVDVVTFEFENIPVEAIEAVGLLRPVRPCGSALHICQNREREKNFLRSGGFPCVAFEVVDSAESLAAAIGRIGTPAVLKTADFGYDGKGQVKLGAGADPREIWTSFGAPRGVLESWISHRAELSVVCARGLNGETTVFPVSENIHERHILDLSIVPARLPAETCAEAQAIAVRITKALDVVGLLAVEFFLAADGTLLVNELAPRPHNSGHYSFDACVTSQFEQQLRAVCGLPLGSTELLSPVVMWNLLGDLWENGEPDWKAVLSDPRVKLHLYGKSDARPRRKMGHVCVLADDVSQALDVVERLKAAMLANCHTGSAN